MKRRCTFTVVEGRGGDFTCNITMIFCSTTICIYSCDKETCCRLPLAYKCTHEREANSRVVIQDKHDELPNYSEPCDMFTEACPPP